MSRIADIDKETGHPMTDLYNKACLLDLPVLPKDRDMAGGTCIILDTFVQETDNIKNEEDLLNLVEKWKNIWLLNDDTNQEEYDIVYGAFDPELVLIEFMKIKNKCEIEEFDTTNINFQIACNICIPRSSLMALMLAKKYGVGSDLGFVRLYLDPYPEHEDALRL